ncbi:MAG: aminomethyl-transferring glycine dehydrogenase subunit GcvPA [bacterium]|jgi:glycine dehydrogenase subunit 1
MSGACYFPNTAADRKAMLEAIGAYRFEDLLEDIPEVLRIKGGLDLKPALSEYEARKLLGRLAGLNASAEAYACFMGAGSYDHYVPSIVSEIASRPEFYTAYTPYQAEISQGTLQSIYEFQSMMARLTGMEISNASLYDGATAMAEAVLMALGMSRKSKVVASGCMNPMRLGVINTYLEGGTAEVVMTGREEGVTRPEDIASLVDEDTGCVIVESPNFFGLVENLETIGAAVKEKNVLFIVSVDPTSLGILAPPSAFGADIAVGEGQSLGNPMNYGGPNLGFIATTRKHMRKLPGRIVGKTVDADGRPCFCLTLQTREQHIRRERATSNICTNQALNALSATVYLSWLGEQGLRELGETCLSLAAYAARELKALGIMPRFAGPFFKEFAVDLGVDAETFVEDALEHGILAGVPLGRFYPDLKNCLLVAFTEKRTRAEIDILVSLIAGAGGGGAKA